ncbi:MAG: hypothetical protein QF681_08500, partial [Vicinamibacterales bacterium]|nr:hypothetical protein [Vicinamibacterales bacterium]
MARAEGELREQTIIPRPHEPFALKIRDEDDAWVLASAVAVVLVAVSDPFLTATEEVGGDVQSR